MFYNQGLGLGLGQLQSDSKEQRKYDLNLLYWLKMAVEKMLDISRKSWRRRMLIHFTQSSVYRANQACLKLVNLKTTLLYPVKQGHKPRS